MGNLFKLNFKIIFLSPIIYIYYSFILFFYVFFIYLLKTFSKPINYAFSLDLLAYLEITIFILSFCVAVFFIQQRHLLEDICFIPKQKIIIFKIISILLACFPICLLPVLFIIINELKTNTSLFFMLMALVYYLSRWLSHIIIPIIFGAALGLLIQFKSVYLIAAPLSIFFSHLNYNFLARIVNYKTASKYSNFLSIQKPFISSVEIDYAMPRVDLQFILKGIIVILLSALIISIINYVLNANKRRFDIILAVALAIILVIACNFYLSCAPIPYDYFDKMYIAKENFQDIKVESYKGKIKLSEYSKFDCFVTFKKNYIGDLITFRLDKCFDIYDIVCENKNINFTRNDDFIILSDELISNKGEYTITFSYGGRVNYVSDIDGVNIYTSFYSSALPPNFAFIPILNENISNVKYDFAIQCSNNLISNLNTQKIYSNVYKIEGLSKSICLFCGFLDYIIYDDIIIYKAAYNFSTNYIDVYQESIKRKFYDPKQNKYVKIEYKKPRKVFMIYYLYGVVDFPVQYDDYIMINYGYPY